MADDIAEMMAEEGPVDNVIPSNDFPPAGMGGLELERKLTAIDREETQSLQLEKTKTDIPPDGGYGWVCVACAWFINAHTWGVNATYGVFLSYYLSHDYFKGTSYLAYAFVGGLSISMAVFIAPVATWTVFKFGTRTCLHIGIFLQTLSLITASFSHQEYQLILTQGVCFGVGMGFVFVGSIGVVPQWFSKRRSFATAIAASGSGAGGLAYSLATSAIIDKYGLPWAYRLLGILSCVCNLVASNILRDRNAAIGSKIKPFDWKLLKRPEFILHQGWTFFTMLGYIVILFSLPAYAQSIGLSARQGSIVGAILNAGQMVGRSITGLASDRYGRLNVCSFATFLCAIFCIVFWIPAKSMGLLTFFAVIGGSVCGTFWSVVAPVTAEVVGIRELPGGLSMTWLCMTLPTTFAEVIALELRRPGSDNVFLHVQIFTAFMYIAASICMWMVRTWKVGEIEQIARLRQELPTTVHHNHHHHPGVVVIHHPSARTANNNETSTTDKPAALTSVSVPTPTPTPTPTHTLAPPKPQQPSWLSKDFLRRLIIIQHV